MYSLSDYRRMIADRRRTDAYAGALRQAVGPETVVVDIGTGTGIFALLACRYGARRVYAIDPDDVIEVARLLAAANGFADRITFVQDLSTRATLPEPAHVIVSDLRGVLPPYGQHIAAVADARRRFLAPGGVLVPRQDTMWTAPVEAPDAYREALTPWDADAYGLDSRPARRVAANAWTKVRVRPEQLLAEPRRWATWDYSTVVDPDVGTELTWTPSRAGVGHGIIVWFDTVLIEGIGFSTGPAAPELVYGAGFFPWAEPVRLEPDDVVAVALRADLAGDDYVWRWETEVRARGGGRKARFAQSNFQGTPLAPDRLRARAGRHVPALTIDGQIDLMILTLMDGRRSLEEIAREVAGRFPATFPEWQHALARAGELSRRYSA